MENVFPTGNELQQVRVGKFQIVLCFETGEISVESKVEINVDKTSVSFQQGEYAYLPKLFSFIGCRVDSVEQNRSEYKIVFTNRDYISLSKENGGHESIVISTKNGNTEVLGPNWI